jgi:magnesium transporter
MLGQSFEQAKPMLRNLHPSEVAAILEEVTPETRAKIFSLLPVERASEVIAEFSEDSNPGDLLLAMSPEAAARIIEELEPDDAADLLLQIPYKELRHIMARLGSEEKKVIRQLMTYPEDTAGGIMTTEILKVPANFTKHEALQEIIRLSDEMEEFYFIYVVNELGQLVGIVSLKSLIRAKANDTVSSLILENIVSVPVDMHQEDVARTMKKWDLPAIPVVDAENKLLGRVTFDDVMDVLEEESTADMLGIAGVSQAESIRGSWWDAVKSRIPWLLMNLLTASLAGIVVALYNGTLERLVILTSYMPVIAGVGGNGATQTLAVTLRRIATDGSNPSHFWKVVSKELLVGLVNGILIGIAVASVALLLNQSAMLGVVVFCAMMGNLVIGALAGSSVPLLVQRLGGDPALASSIFITPLTDVIGYSLLLGLSSLLLL